MTIVALAGCTPEQAAPFGQVLFALMIVFLAAVPWVFYRAWKDRTKH